MPDPSATTNGSPDNGADEAELVDRLVREYRALAARIARSDGRACTREVRQQLDVLHETADELERRGFELVRARRRR